MSDKKTPKAETKKTLSRGTAKKVSKSVKLAKKVSGKTIVRNSRSTIRAVNAEKTKKATNSRMKTKLPGHSPQSSRITALKGDLRPISSKTNFLGENDADRKWLLVDASGQTVGRLASQLAILLRGKHKANFTPNNDTGDFVVVINAEKVTFTGNKEEAKKYNWHSQFVGGIKQSTPARLRQKYPERILENAVKGMISRNPLGRDQMKKLKIYAGEQHPHAAQKPVVWKLRHDSVRETK